MKPDNSFLLKTLNNPVGWDFETQDDVFHPTDTTVLLIEAAMQVIHGPKKILDLGCGSGVVGLALALQGLNSGPVYASDISDKAVRLAIRNADQYKIPLIARCGSLFEPWQGQKFSVIIDDVAGIADDIAPISSWYSENIPCNAGEDGTKWIVQIISTSREYLTEDGILVFPVLSLSNQAQILRTLKETYTNFELILKKDWFVPEEIAQSEIFLSLNKRGLIQCHRKYGRWLWSTSVYQAINSH